MSTQISKLSESAIQKYAERKAKFDKVQERFDEYKAEFEQAMEACFQNELSSNRTKIEMVDDDGRLITVTRVAKPTIEWFADKLKPHLTREVYSQCIKKRYEITDIKGLTRYLKSCGVDPNIFKRYIAVEESVDTEMIDNVSQRGLLEARDIRGAYLVHCAKPYYTVKVKGAREDE